MHTFIRKLYYYCRVKSMLYVYSMQNCSSELLTQASNPVTVHLISVLFINVKNVTIANSGFWVMEWVTTIINSNIICIQKDIYEGHSKSSTSSFITLYISQSYEIVQDYILESRLEISRCFTFGLFAFCPFFIFHLLWLFLNETMYNECSQIFS